MFPTYEQLRVTLSKIIADKNRQGHITTGMIEEFRNLPDSYDALYSFAEHLAHLPIREDWPYIEPNDWHGIEAELDPDRLQSIIQPLQPQVIEQRIEAAFLGSVCGCILGKPLEINPNMDEIQQALEPLGEWPLKNYVSERAAHNFKRPPHPDWIESVQEHIRWVTPDDDLNYTILGMLVLEQYGINFTHQNILKLWMSYLPPAFTWGPEHTILTKAALATSYGDEQNPDDEILESWVSLLNPEDEYCGALIRVDAYGYACAGNPALAAEMAWRDASLTHRRTGIYAAMFIAAAIATAFVAKNPIEIFDTALKFVPRRSRFYSIVSDLIHEVSQASNWLEGYQRVHDEYHQYGHCQVYQEIGTLINTLCFAENVGDGICKQVMQGNDTDSFGARAGSILGAFFGPGYLENRWIEPFGDEVRTKLAGFPERSLAKLSSRMGALPNYL